MHYSVVLLRCFLWKVVCYVHFVLLFLSGLGLLVCKSFFTPSEMNKPRAAGNVNSGQTKLSVVLLLDCIKNRM